MAQLPENYTISTDGEYQPGKPKLVVLRAGERIESGWHMDQGGAEKSSWCDYYENLAKELNKDRADEDTVLAWIHTPTGDVYADGHIDHFIPLKELREVTVVSHMYREPEESRWYIRNLLCSHCGEAAVDDDLLHEMGFYTDESYDEETEDEEE